MVNLFKNATGKEPKLISQGGEKRENKALHSVQDRIKMVTSYYFAQLTQWSRNKRDSLLVLSSTNIDEW